jgi:hypothetical protein
MAHKLNSQVSLYTVVANMHLPGVVEGRGDGLYCLFHDEADLEALPVTENATLN